MPVHPFAMDTRAAAHEVEICPSTPKDLGATKSGSFHQENRWPLPADRRATNVLKLLKARAIDVRLRASAACESSATDPHRRCPQPRPRKRTSGGQRLRSTESTPSYRATAAESGAGPQW